APFSWLGGQLRQQIFNPPSVFSYYPPSYPVAGTAKLVGPEFGIHNANGALNRLNFLTYLLDWNGSTPDPSIPGATGTKVVLDSFLAGAGDHVALVDRLSLLMIGKPLADLPREKVISAVKWWTKDRDPQNWKLQRIRTAAYLVMASPDYQVPQ
ncbi:DUF1800 family protein, partial [Ideonella sp.]|uniref:DUF1800 family protein n=1 Tax=Ideonella sp. TaxID=1929293 RepID=UPI003BB70639